MEDTDDRRDGPQQYNSSQAIQWRHLHETLPMLNR